MATKKAYSQHPVRQSTHFVSVKASEILHYFSNPSIADALGHDWSTGLIYIRGYAALDRGLFDGSTEAQEIIGLCPAWLLSCQTVSKGNEVTFFCRDAAGHLYIEKKTTDDFFVQLQAHYAALESELATESNMLTESMPQHGFRGGLAGFIGYDPEAQAQQCSFSLPSIPQSDTRATAKQHISEASSLLAAMGHYDIFLKQEQGAWVLYGPNAPTLSELYHRIDTCLTQLPATSTATSRQSAPFQVIHPFKPAWHIYEYQCAFVRIQEYLRAGDCYQVNLTQPFIAEVTGSLLDTLDALMTLTQAPYSGYMRVGAHELLSCSPELFLAFSGPDSSDLTGKKTAHHNQVVTRPIKGTFPRSSDPVLDLAYKNQLTHSEKDHSENLMIVDLLRNDLSRHAETGSVQVPVLFAVESFAQVHHLVSEVSATLSRDATPLDVLLAALPGGSITGAPKKRAMEIISELEAAPRGAYCGSLGYLNHNGSGQFNILIRTLQQHGAHLVAWAGGGITVASQLEAEYQECFDKIKAILDCINQFQPKVPEKH